MSHIDSNELSLRDIFLALHRRAKVFWGAYVLVIILGLVFVVSHALKAQMVTYMSPTHYIDSTSVHFVQNADLLVGRLNAVFIPQIIQEDKGKKAYAGIELGSLKASLPAVGEKRTQLDWVALSVRGWHRDPAAYAALFAQVNDLVVNRQKYLANQLKSLWEMQVTSYQNVLRVDSEQLKHLVAQQPELKKLLAEEYPPPRQLGKGALDGLGSTLFGLVKVSNSAQLMHMVIMNSQRRATLRNKIEQAKLDLGQTQRRMATLHLANLISPPQWVSHSGIESPVAQLILIFIIGFILAFIVSLLVDAISVDGE